MSAVSLNLLINNGPLLIPGQSIKGTLTVNVPFGIFLDVSGIYLQFRGFERIRFRQRADSHGVVDDIELNSVAIGNPEMSVSTGIPTILPISQPHFLQKVLICATHPISRFRGKLPSGSHAFQFDFKVDGKLPPSLNFSSGSKYFAAIEYEIFVQVFGKKEGANLALTQPIKLANLMKRSHLPFVHEDQLQLKRTWSCCILPSLKEDLEDLEFFADWKKNSFTLGTSVNFVFSLKLPPSAPVSGLLSVKLVRELFLIIDERNSFRTVDPVAKSKFPITEASSGLVNGSVQLVIPDGLEPTVRTTAIDCRYFFVFEIKLKGRESLLTTAEVYIY